MGKLRFYDTPADAMRATLADRNIPVLRGRIARKNRIDVEQLARDIGCSVKYLPELDKYRFTPGN